MTQEALANKAKLQATAVSHFENGSRKPSFDNLRNLADALESTVDYLMGRTDKPHVFLSHGDELFKDFKNLTAADREIARDFMKTLARRNRRR